MLLNQKAFKLLIPTLFVLFGGISFGSIFSANKISYESGLPYFSYIFWQIFLGSIILLSISLITKSAPTFNWKNIRVFTFVAVLGLISPILVFNVIADKLPPGVVTLSVALIPASTYIISVLVKADRLRTVSVMGVVIGFGSVLFIVIPGKSLPIDGAEIWVVFSLLVPVACGINNAFSGLLRPAGAQTFGLAAGTMIIASLILLPVCFVHSGLYIFVDYGWEAIVSTIWAAVVWVIVYICFYEVIKRTSGLFYAQINYVIVAAGLVWSWIIYADILSVWVWVAVALLFLSLFLINKGAQQTSRGRNL